MKAIILLLKLTWLVTVSVLSLSYTPCKKYPFPKMVTPSNSFHSMIEFIDTDVNSDNMIATAGKFNTTGYAFTIFGGDEEVSYKWQRQVFID